MIRLAAVALLALVAAGLAAVPAIGVLTLVHRPMTFRVWLAGYLAYAGVIAVVIATGIATWAEQPG